MNEYGGWSVRDCPKCHNDFKPFVANQESCERCMKIKNEKAETPFSMDAVPRPSR